MDYHWWAYETNVGVDHQNDYANSSQNSFAYETPSDYISCNHCGNNHFDDQCPFVYPLDFGEDDFGRVQAQMYENTFSPRQNHVESMFWDPNCSLSPCISHFESSPNFHVGEAYPIPRDKPTIEDMLQLLLDNDEKLLARQEKNTLSLERLALQMSEISSNLEALIQRGILSHMSIEASMEDEITREELIIEGEKLLPMTCDDFGGDGELEIIDGENKIEPLGGVSTLEPIACLEQENGEGFSSTYNIDPPRDVLPLTDECQVDFIGFSKYLGGMDSYCDIIKLEPSIVLINLCISKPLVIDVVHTCLNEHSCLLQSFCNKRNEDKLIVIFDTYD